MTRFPRFSTSDRDREDLELGHGDPDWDPGAPEFQRLRARVPKRFVTTLALVSLFFAGASFVAGAGDRAAKLIQGEESAQAVAGAAAADPAAQPDAGVSSDPAASDPAASADASAPAVDSSAPAVEDPAASSDPAAAASDPSSDPAAGDAAPADSSGADQAAADTAASDPAAPDSGASGDVRPHGSASAGASADVSGPAPVQAARRVRKQLTARKPVPDPEVRLPGVSATIWLNRALPDPTPPAKRLTPQFAARLVRTSRHVGADWALVLGVLRAEGATGASPAGPATLGRLSRRLVGLESSGRNKWEAAASFVGDTSTADRAVALGHYYRAVGLWSLVHGLEAAKVALAKKVLDDPRVDVYPGGRSDLEHGRVDVRVIAVIAYMAESFGQVRVSCLISGHRLYARPGVVSAHVYGHAIDIAALGGESIEGNQQPGGVTEHAVRDLLLLPPELLPRQVISLLGLGGPSFALADHYNHIHVGY
jgi:hypothetical protein